MKTFSEYCEERFTFSDAMTVNMMIGAISAYLQQHDLELLRFASLNANAAKITRGASTPPGAKWPKLNTLADAIQRHEHGAVIIILAMPDDSYSEIAVPLDGPAFEDSKRYPAFTNLANACREAGNALHHAVYDASHPRSAGDVVT